MKVCVPYAAASGAGGTGVPKTLGLALCTTCGARAYSRPAQTKKGNAAKSTRSDAQTKSTPVRLSPCARCGEVWYCSEVCAAGEGGFLLSCYTRSLSFIIILIIAASLDSQFDPQLPLTHLSAT